MRSLRRLASPLHLALLVFGSSSAILSGGCTNAAPPDDAGSSLDPEGASLGTSDDALIKCPETDPDYPYCAPVDRCEGATGTLTATPATIALGGQATLRYTITKPTGCNGTASINGQTVNSGGGAITVSPLTATAYTLKLGTRALRTTSVNVTLPSVVRINGSSLEWRKLLVQAVQTPNTRVVLADNVDMDMSNLEHVYVREGVTLTSEAPPIVVAPVATGAKGALALPGPVLGPPPPSRNGQNLGPRLYTNTKPRPLFFIRCNQDHTLWGDNVRFAGFRIQGPHMDMVDGDDNLEIGIKVESCLNVDIDNMELSGFSGQAISIDDELWRQFNPSAVRIHDSYIHNNQHKGTNGYGVGIGDRAYAGIERNVFDFNRHAIKGSGASGVGYRADRNLVLRGGGVHGTLFNPNTHQFDVHGDANCPDIPGNQHTWNCGNAGDQFWFTNNAFQYTNDLAIKLRGVPRIQANITGNVFAHDSLGDAVGTKSSVHINMSGNTADVDTYGQYGVCDFDGDGKDDLFLATGVSWWYASGGRMNWTYLGPNSERLHQVGLGDFNGDGRCDVVARNAGSGLLEIASGGRTAWTALPGNVSVPFEELRFGDFDGDKVTDIFRRLPNGEWWAISPGRWGWTLLGSSSLPLAELRFGDFDGNGVTDVMRRNGSTWQVSFGGRTQWQPWSSNGDELEKLVIGNVDGIAGDDVLRYVIDSGTSGHWDISSGGRGSWRRFAAAMWPTMPDDGTPAYRTRSFIGRFDSATRPSLLSVDATRFGKRFDVGSNAFVAHSLFAF